MVMADTRDLQADVMQALQDFWESYAGVRPARVRVVSDQQVIAVWLEDVLSPAERQMAGTQAGRAALQEFGARILEQARPGLQQVVGEVMGQGVALAEIHLDVANGSILGFFLLE